MSEWNDRADRLDEVGDELARAIDKHPEWPTDPLHALAILGEEYGELTQAMLQRVYEPRKIGRGKIRKAAVQTAAMALRLINSLDAYEYKPSKRYDPSAQNNPDFYDP